MKTIKLYKKWILFVRSYIITPFIPINKKHIGIKEKISYLINS
jgi:hypothetical protein